MIISAQIIWKPRKARKCASCGKPIEGITLRLFGMAERGDKPYPQHVHVRDSCGAGAKDVKPLLKKMQDDKGNRLASFRCENCDASNGAGFLVCHFCGKIRSDL